MSSTDPSKRIFMTEEELRDLLKSQQEGSPKK